MPAAGGITSLSFSFSPVTIVATLFIDVTVPGHDIPEGRSESSVQSGDVGGLPSPIYSSPSSCRTPFAKDVAPIFAITSFFIVPSTLREINIFRFSLYLDSFALSSTMRELLIVWRRDLVFQTIYHENNLFSELVFSPGDQSIHVSIPTTSSRQERLECLNKCLNYTVHEK